MGLANVSGAPLLVTIGGREMRLSQMQIGWLAEVESYMESKRTNLVLELARNLEGVPEKLHEKLHEKGLI